MPATNFLQFDPREPKFSVHFPYRGKISGYEVQANCPTAFGLKTKVAVTFEVEKPTSTGIELVPHKEYFLASKSPESKFGKMVFGVTERPVGNRFDLDSLLGVDIMIQFKHNVSADGDTYDNVDSVWRVSTDLTQGEI
jgi:hypothetical protein